MRAVEAACGGDLEALHAAGERERGVGLDDGLEAARANDDRDDAEVGARERPAQGATDRGVGDAARERGRGGDDARGDVHRVAR